MAVTQPSNFKASNHRLWQELVALRSLWDEYTYLFGESKERVQLLNDTATSFFGIVQRLMARELILAVSRLTETKRANLTLCTLLSNPNRAEKPEFFDTLEERIKAVRTRARPITLYRHKQIAHLDYAVALDESDEPLPRFRRTLMEEVITEAESIFGSHAETMLTPPPFFAKRGHGPASALISALLKAKSQEDQKAV